MLTWDYSKQIGTATLEQKISGEVRRFTLSLYEGNAFLILTHQYQGEDGKEMERLISFFYDAGHLRRCLDDGMFTGWERITAIRIDKSVSRNWKSFVPVLAEYLDDITVEFFRSGDHNHNESMISTERWEEIAKKAMDYIDMEDCLQEFLRRYNIHLSWEEKESLNLIDSYDIG